MQGKDFLYFLTDSQGRSFYVNNGIVTLSTLPKPLAFTPGDWQDITIDNMRNATYFALDRSFSIPIKFVEDGALILKNQYYKYGIEAKVFLVIARQKIDYDGTSYGYSYTSMYRGELDFTQFTHAGPIVDIKVLEGDFPKLVRSKQNVTYEIDMNVPNGEYVKWDGIVLRQTAKYINIETRNFGELAYLHMLPIVFLSKDGESSGFLNKSQGQRLDSSDYFLFATLPTTIYLKGSIKFKAGPSILAVILQLRKSTNGANSQVVSQRVYNPVATNTEIEWSFDLQIPLLPNELLYFTGDAAHIPDPPNQIPNSNSPKYIQYYETEINASYSSRFDTTYVKCFPPLYVFEKLIENISGGQYKVQSNALSQYSDFKLTCGDAIRRVPEPKFKTTLADFFQSMNSQLDLGMGIINGIVRLEHKSFFVDYNNPIDLGEVRNLRIKPDLESMFTILKIGSSDQTYNELNGREEFNSTMEFNSPLTSVSKELNLVSSYRTDSYGAEFVRINLEGKSTTDGPGDSDIWIIHTNKNPYGYFGADSNKPVFELNRDLNKITTGLLEVNSVFNLFLSPKHALLRHGQYIRSCFYNMDSAILKFQTIGKNRDVVVGGQREIDDVQIGALPPPIFIPQILEFEVPSPVELIDMLDASPVRAFEFSYLGIRFKGIPIRAGINPGENKVQSFILISAPDNDLTQLQEIFE